MFKYDPKRGGGFCDRQLAYGGVGADDVASLKYLHTFWSPGNPNQSLPFKCFERLRPKKPVTAIVPFRDALRPRWVCTIFILVGGAVRRESSEKQEPTTDFWKLYVIFIVFFQ